MNSDAILHPLFAFGLLTAGAGATFWLTWKATRLGPLSSLASGGLFFWSIAGLLYFAGSYFPAYSRLANFFWIPLYIGYTFFIFLAGSLPSPSKFPRWLYGSLAFPIGVYLIVLPYVAYKTPLTITFALELLLIYYALPLWYALVLGEAPEGRSVWIPALILFGASASIWFSLTPSYSSVSIIMVTFVWWASEWLLVSGLELETNGWPVPLTHLSLVVINFLTIWMLILEQWHLSEHSIQRITWEMWLAGIASAFVGPLSVFIPLYFFKRRSESKLARWSSILSQLATFLWKRENPTPESIALEIYRLFKQACDNVAGVRLAIFDDLTIGERTDHGIVLRDHDLLLGRVYTSDSDSCLQLLETMSVLTSQRLREVIRSLDWRSKAQTDPLTGLLNRRGFEINVHYSVERAKIDHWPVTVAMLNIDQFKDVNDSAGHAAGDDLLRKVAMALRKNLRDDDMVVLWGGEKFLILLADSNLDQAAKVFERISGYVKKLRVPGVEQAITISVGLAGGRTPDSVKVIEEWIDQADEALRATKQKGSDHADKDS